MRVRTATGPARRPSGARRAALLALPAALLVAGCQGSAGPEPSAAPAVDRSAPAAGSSAGSASCPDAAALLALLPGTDGGTPAGLGTPDTTCSGDWAEIGVRYPGSQGVALFHRSGGDWQPRDTAEACAGSELPAQLRPGACQAG